MLKNYYVLLEKEILFPSLFYVRVFHKLENRTLKTKYLIIGAITGKPDSVRRSLGSTPCFLRLHSSTCLYGGEPHPDVAECLSIILTIKEMLFRLKDDTLRRSSTERENIDTVPIHLKMLLTIRETAEYSNICINKIDTMLKDPNCPFVLYIGTRKLVKRVEFEEYIMGKVAI